MSATDAHNCSATILNDGIQEEGISIEKTVLSERTIKKY